MCCSTNLFGINNFTRLSRDQYQWQCNNKYIIHINAPAILTKEGEFNNLTKKYHNIFEDIIRTTSALIWYWMVLELRKFKPKNIYLNVSKSGIDSIDNSFSNDHSLNNSAAFSVTTAIRMPKINQIKIVGSIDSLTLLDTV